MPDIPLIKVRYVNNFARAIAQSDVSIDGLLHKAGLTKSVLQFSENYIPVSRFHKFTNAAVAETGNFLLGLNAGTSPRITHSEFSRELALAPKLYDTLQALIADSKTEDTTATFRVIMDQGFAWLTCGRVRSDEEAAWQMELYRYGALLDVIRYAAGPDWLPRALRLQSRDDGRLQKLPILENVEIRFGCSRLAIAIEPGLLGEPLRRNDPLLKRNATAALPAGPTLFADAVLEVMRTLIRTRKPAIAELAEMVGMAPRSLQRYLGEAGTSYSKLLDETRVEYAQSMLEDFEVPLCAIADELGYRHSTHFSRAFKRLKGVTPSEYRRDSRRN